MPFAILLLGAILIVVAIRGSHLELASLVKEDFGGSQPFWIWIAAIVAVGALGYSPVLKTPARVLLLLIILAMLLSNQGVLQKFADAMKSPPAPSPAQDTAGDPAQLPKQFPVAVTQTDGGSGGSTAGNIIGTAAKILPLFG